MQQQTVVNDSGFLKYSWAHVAIFNIFLLAWSFFMHYHLRAQRSSTFNWGFLHVLWFLWIPWIFLQYYVWYCQTLSSSAFVSSPIYGPSCFPVIISSVSVSRVSWLCPRCLQLCLHIYIVCYAPCYLWIIVNVMCQTCLDVLPRVPVSPPFVIH